MKKFLRIAAASMLSCLVLATAAAAYTPVGNVSVPKATPTIDGTINDGEYPESGHSPRQRQIHKNRTEAKRRRRTAKIPPQRRLCTAAENRRRHAKQKTNRYKFLHLDFSLPKISSQTE